jgi:hypothetical protein
VGPRTGLDDVEKRKFLTLPGLELRPLCRSARSQSLYRLRYPGSAGNRRVLITQGSRSWECVTVAEDLVQFQAFVSEVLNILIALTEGLFLVSSCTHTWAYAGIPTEAVLKHRLSKGMYGTNVLT